MFVKPRKVCCQFAQTKTKGNTCLKTPQNWPVTTFYRQDRHSPHSLLTNSNRDHLRLGCSPIFDWVKKTSCLQKLYRYSQGPHCLKHRTHVNSADACLTSARKLRPFPCGWGVYVVDDQRGTSLLHRTVHTHFTSDWPVNQWLLLAATFTRRVSTNQLSILVALAIRQSFTNFLNDLQKVRLDRRFKLGLQSRRTDK